MFSLGSSFRSHKSSFFSSRSKTNTSNTKYIKESPEISLTSCQNLHFFYLLTAVGRSLLDTHEVKVTQIPPRLNPLSYLLIFMPMWTLSCLTSLIFQKPQKIYISNYRSTWYHSMASVYQQSNILAKSVRFCAFLRKTFFLGFTLSFRNLKFVTWRDFLVFIPLRFKIGFTMGAQLMFPKTQIKISVLIQMIFLFKINL